MNEDEDDDETYHYRMTFQLKKTGPGTHRAVRSIESHHPDGTEIVTEYEESELAEICLREGWTRVPTTSVERVMQQILPTRSGAGTTRVCSIGWTWTRAA